MTNQDGVRWRCPNRDCDWCMVATMPIGAETTPRCVCGSVMEKAESVPAFRYLDFLRFDREIEVETGTDKD